MKPSRNTDPSDDDPGPSLLNRQRKVSVAAGPLRDFLGSLRRQVAGERAFSVCLVSDRAIRGYNRRFRGQDCPTDVLSFPDGERGRAGDVVISAETARRQARRLGHGTETEIRILALHGLLHLLGLDHESPRDRGRMARRERRWRRRFGLPEGQKVKSEK